MDAHCFRTTNEKKSITPLLARMADSTQEHVSASEIADTVKLIFNGQVSEVQCASLLTLLTATGRLFDASVVQKCAARMRDAAEPIDLVAVKQAAQGWRDERRRGKYRGGVCDLVGTGGDGHSTFNVSTTASIIASAYLLIAKHGSRASSSKSGSADMLQAIAPLAPRIEAVDIKSVVDVYRHSSYAFLFASTFHAGMKYIAPVRRELGFRTLFNILGPLANPLDSICEARVVGVATRRLGPVFAEALRMNGVKKAMVVCGAEELDEISCAGRTYCWRLMDKSQPDDGVLPEPGSPTWSTSSGEEYGPHNLEVLEFQLSPKDFGLPAHPLSAVLPGKGPADNAAVLMKMLNNQLPDNDPTQDFVLINTAALFVISGICDSKDSEAITEVGPGKGRWKEGIRLARKALREGKAAESLNQYIQFTNK